MMETKTYYSLGLIGYPLEHSLSPKLHTAALETTNLKGEYKLYPIPTSEKLDQQLTEILEQVKRGSITGLNVTIPYKTTVISHLEKLTDTANQSGAVNTIFLDKNKLCGDNTDVWGFLKDLDKFINSLPDEANPRDLMDRYALVLGAGGAARAVVYGLLETGWKVTIAARNHDKSDEIAHRYNINYKKNVARGIRISLEDINSLKHPIHLLVNATSAGMWPDVDNSPWIEGRKFPERIIVYDLIYNPGTTRLFKQARNQNLFATTGLGMLVEQAALSFNRWTGKMPSVDKMREAIRTG
jgi:shikimate dehydrogenase